MTGGVCCSLGNLSLNHLRTELLAVFILDNYDIFNQVNVWFDFVILTHHQSIIVHIINNYWVWFCFCLLAFRYKKWVHYVGFFFNVGFFLERFYSIGLDTGQSTRLGWWRCGHNKEKIDSDDWWHYFNHM